MSEPTHADVVAADLQRQLDELREIVLRGGGASLPTQHGAVPAERLLSDNEKQRVRITHLLRALDAKDRQIAQLQAEVARQRR